MGRYLAAQEAGVGNSVGNVDLPVAYFVCRPGRTFRDLRLSPDFNPRSLASEIPIKLLGKVYSCLPQPCSSSFLTTGFHAPLMRLGFF